MKITRIGAALMMGSSLATGLALGPGWVQARLFGIHPAAAEASDSQQNARLLMVLNDVMARVQSDYIEPVSSRTLIENAMNGMLTGLDPHSSYMNEQQWHEMQTETSGHFGGIGLELTDKGGILQVISPIDGTPAADAGIKPGDLITAVTGKSIDGVSRSDAITEMRGPPNTRVELVLKRQGFDSPIMLTLTRRIIHILPVKSTLIGDVGVLRISEFNEQADSGVRAAMKALRTESGGRLRGLILDLRNDPGGLLDQAIAVSNDFLDSGAIVSTRGRLPDDNQSWSAKPNHDISGGLPIVVLTNTGTASASEIVAGALQDDRRALVLGTRSFGKGSVQTLFPLQGNGAIRLTTARYYTPSGRSIQGVGITPNVEVQETRTPVARFEPQHEADLRHILSNDGSTVPANPPPPADLPAVAQQIPRMPPVTWPKLDPAKPATDFQLQQGLVLLRAMAAGPLTVSR
jgi:carboxyl-terminal processing protease